MTTKDCNVTIIRIVKSGKKIDKVMLWCKNEGEQNRRGVREDQQKVERRSKKLGGGAKVGQGESFYDII